MRDDSVSVYGEGFTAVDALFFLADNLFSWLIFHALSTVWTTENEHHLYR